VLSGKYRASAIGVGGMDAVYEATHQRKGHAGRDKGDHPELRRTGQSRDAVLGEGYGRIGSSTRAPSRVMTKTSPTKAR